MDNIMPFRAGLSARVCAGLLFILAAAACFASSYPKLSLNELVSQSETIVSGTVLSSSTAWDSEHRFIWTHTQIKINGTLKGKSQAVITVSEPGGTADGMTMQIPGATVYTPGENVHVFLYRTPLGYMRTTGYGQGKFAVSADGRVHADKNLAGVETVDGLTATEFRSRVANTIASQKGAVTK
jgi:hypothetical protein